jgi:hypothetical protein
MPRNQQVVKGLLDPLVLKVWAREGQEKTSILHVSGDTPVEHYVLRADRGKERFEEG